MILTKKKQKRFLEGAGFKYIDDTGIRKKIVSQKSSFSLLKILNIKTKIAM